MTADQIEELYSATYRQLVAGVSVLTNDRAQAEEAVQEAFVRLIPRAAKVLNYDDPVAWLRRVATNVAIDNARRERYGRQLRRRLVGRANPSYDLPDTADAEVRVAVMRLPPAQQRVVVMRYGFDLDLRSIARETAQSEAAVRNQLHRARAALRERLQTHKPISNLNQEEADHVDR